MDDLSIPPRALVGRHPRVLIRVITHPLIPGSGTDPGVGIGAVSGSGIGSGPGHGPGCGVGAQPVKPV